MSGRAWGWVLGLTAALWALVYFGGAFRVVP